MCQLWFGGYKLVMGYYIDIVQILLVSKISSLFDILIRYDHVI